MGMYTEIYVNTDLKKETPQEVIEVLSAMCDKNHEAECLSNKPSRWVYLFNNGSFYLPLTECGKLTHCSIADQYSLLAKGDIKNYNGEIEEFFDFIKPWCEDEFIGYYRYEESREPTLVYADTQPRDSHANGSESHQEPVVMVPYLKNRADAVDGHYCIARLNPRGYHEFWNEKQKGWCSTGSVFELGKEP